MSRRQRFFICGGGTGGHFFSGLALGEIFLKKHPDAEVIFVGTKNGIEARYPLHDSRMSKLFILSKGVKGKSMVQKVLALAFIFLGILQSVYFLVRFRPRIVAGVGGYASAPTVFAALFLRWLFRWRIFVLDQNSTPGIVNKIFSRLPLHAYCAFDFRGFQTVDLPLRQNYITAAERRRQSEWPPKTILVVGGSQGARGMNDRWLNLLPQLKSRIDGLRVIHQTGAADESRVREAYRTQQIESQVFAFSDELPRFFNEADLVVCRSGALSVFEVLAFQRPAIFIPFPKATDDHQTKNALSVQRPEWVVPEAELTWDRLKSLLDQASPAVPQRQLNQGESWDRILS